MKRILCSDWLSERATWAYLASSRSIKTQKISTNIECSRPYIRSIDIKVITYFLWKLQIFIPGICLISLLSISLSKLSRFRFWYRLKENSINDHWIVWAYRLPQLSYYQLIAREYQLISVNILLFIWSWLIVINRRKARYFCVSWWKS